MSGGENEFTTEEDLLRDAQDKLMPYLIPALIIGFTVAIVGGVGNILVFYIYKYKLRVSISSYLIMALAVYDFIMCTVFNVIFLAELFTYWTNRDNMTCKIIWTLFNSVSFGNMLLLIVISVYSYIHQCHPLYVVRKRTIKIVCALTIFVPLPLTVPCSLHAYGVTVGTTPVPGVRSHICFLDEDNKNSVLTGVNQYITVGFISLVAMSFIITYGHIMWKNKNRLKKKQKPRKSSTHDTEAQSPEPVIPIAILSTDPETISLHTIESASVDPQSTPQITLQVSLPPDSSKSSQSSSSDSSSEDMPLSPKHSTRADPVPQRKNTPRNLKTTPSTKIDPAPTPQNLTSKESTSIDPATTPQTTDDASKGGLASGVGNEANETHKTTVSPTTVSIRITGPSSSSTGSFEKNGNITILPSQEKPRISFLEGIHQAKQRTSLFGEGITYGKKRLSESLTQIKKRMSVFAEAVEEARHCCGKEINFFTDQVSMLMFVVCVSFFTSSLPNAVILTLTTEAATHSFALTGVFAVLFQFLFLPSLAHPLIYYTFSKRFHNQVVGIAAKLCEARSLQA